jgi:hypothetical protein
MKQNPNNIIRNIPIDETLLIDEIEHKYAFIHRSMKCDNMNVSNLVF